MISQTHRCSLNNSQSGLIYSGKPLIALLVFNEQPTYNLGFKLMIKLPIHTKTFVVSCNAVYLPATGGAAVWLMDKHFSE